MKIFNKHILSGLCLLAVLFMAACGGDDSSGSLSISPFQIINDTTIRLHGEIDSNTLEAFNEVISQNPNTELLIFGIAPGSSDDEINLQVGRRLHQLGLNTHVEDNGEISSGAVDLFFRIPGFGGSSVKREKNVFLRGTMIKFYIITTKLVCIAVQK